MIKNNDNNLTPPQSLEHVSCYYKALCLQEESYLSVETDLQSCVIEKETEKKYANQKKQWQNLHSSLKFSLKDSAMYNHLFF